MKLLEKLKFIHNAISIFNLLLNLSGIIYIETIIIPILIMIEHFFRRKEKIHFSDLNIYYLN